MPSAPRTRPVLPDWAKELTPEEIAEIEAIDWDAEGFLDDDDMTVVIRERPRTQGRRELQASAGF